MLKWIFRSLLLLLLIVIAVGVWRGIGVTNEQAPVAAGDDRAPTLDDAGPGPTLADPDDAPASSLQNPLTRSFDQLLSVQEQILPDGGGEIRDNLQQADDLLTQARQNNRSAIREANRQVRASGRSANLLLITVDGLKSSDLVWFTGTAEEAPTIDLFAASSVRQKVRPLNPEQAKAALLTAGRQSQIQADSITLTNMLWQAGYTTAVIGDCSWWPLHRDVDEWMGARTAEENTLFPQFVWSNGNRVEVVANQDGNQAVSRNDLNAAELTSYIRRHRAGRPFFLTLSLTADNDAALRSADALVQTTLEQLTENELAYRTLVVVLGIPPEGDIEPAPLIIRGDFSLPSNADAPNPAGFGDLGPSLLEVAGALAKYPGGGVSQVAYWKRAVRNRVE